MVTGAGKGIGKAVAIALAQEGVHVALMARTESQLQEVAREIAALGVKTAVVTADVSDGQAVNAAVAQAQAELGFLDILINNAGTATFGKFLEIDPADWERNIQVNLMGVYHTTRAV